MIIEWNAHIFSPDTQRYPLHPKATYRPDVSVHPPDPLAAYLQRLDDEGIDRAVVVHPEPYGDDHQLILECLKREPERLRGTSLFYPQDPDAPQKLADLVAREPKIIATRFHAYRDRDLYFDSFNDKGVRALWEKAVELGLVVELHIEPSYGAQVAQVLRDIPQTVALVDHLAEPHMGSAVEYADILDLSCADAEVYMKLSGFGHFAQDAPLYESAKSFTRRVIEAFGPERMVWGSGTPVIVDAHLSDYGEAERALVKGGNLVRWFNK